MGTLPIRKISSTEVGLSSYYGKTFVSSENRVNTDASGWLLKQIEKASFTDGGYIHNVIPGNSFDSYAKTPYIYSLLSTRFSSLKAGNITLTFGETLQTPLTPEIAKQIQARGMVYCGHQDRDGNQPIFVDQDNEFYTLQGSTFLGLGTIYDILKLDRTESPVRFSDLALFRKNVPVGIILGYRLGWTKLLALLNVKPRIVPPRTRPELATDEYVVVFQDATYIFSQKDKLATMILAGFMSYAKTAKNYPVSDFENQAVYLNLLTTKGLGSVYVREIDMMFDYFVDPITQEVLQDMGEPTTFEGLLVRASEMLLSYGFPKAQDGTYSRIRGYERVAGAIYKELTQAIRTFRSKNIAGRSKIDIGHYAVWENITKDSTKMMVPDINPLQDLKNDEGATLVGEGGRSSRGINKASRAYHAEDIGIVSEGTVDSSIVGVNISVAANPHFKNHRGLKGIGTVESTNKHCSAVLMAPAVTHDD